MTTKSDIFFPPSRNHFQVYSEVVRNTHLFCLGKDSLAEVIKLALRLPERKRQAHQQLSVAWESLPGHPPPPLTKG